jgi:phage terminase small subunit
MALTDKQKRFCDEYLIDLNATQAAIRAGYSSKRASEQAYQLLQKTTVQEYIQKRKADRIERVEITQDFVLAELKAIASVNATDYARVVEKNATALVDGVEIQLYDAEGNPVKYRTVEPILTDELTDIQKKALAVIKKGRDGFEIRPYDKLKVLELIGKHLGMWEKKQDAEPEMQDDGFIDAIRGEVEEVWQAE